MIDLGIVLKEILIERYILMSTCKQVGRKHLQVLTPIKEDLVTIRLACGSCGHTM
jgi:hypothetical protein